MSVTFDLTDGYQSFLFPFLYHNFTHNFCSATISFVLKPQINFLMSDKQHNLYFKAVLPTKLKQISEPVNILIKVKTLFVFILQQTGTQEAVGWFVRELC